MKRKHKTLMDKANKWWIAALAITGFIALAWYSYPPQNFIDKKVAAYDSSKTKPYKPRPNRWNYTAKAKPVDDWTPPELKPEVAAQVVYLFGEK